MRALATILVACALVASGCGDDSDDNGGGGSAYGGGGEASSDGGGASSDGGGASRLKLTADPGGALEFDKTSLTTKAGKVTIALDNPSDVPHAVEVEGNGVEEETETVTGASAKVTVDLEPGEYEFYCPVGNHQQEGMEGTLTVR